MNIPKFLSEDLPLFENIILDLFPTVEQSDVKNQLLTEKILESCSELNLQPEKNFLTKIYQLYDTIQVRHGLMLVGNTGGGKTSNFNILKLALNKLAKAYPEDYMPIEHDIINPKAMTLF